MSADLLMTCGCSWARTVEVDAAAGGNFNLTGYTVEAYLYYRGLRATVTAAVASPATNGIINLSLAAVPEAPYQIGELRIFGTLSGAQERIATYTVRLEPGETLPSQEEAPEEEA